MPQICDQQLGRGLNFLSLNYNNTFIGNAEKGYYTDIQSDVFLLWKNKLQKHEDKVLAQANTAYRNDKKQEKVRLEKLKIAQEQQFKSGNAASGVMHERGVR